MPRSALLSLARATGRVCVEPQLSVRLQPTLDRWKDFSPFLRSFGLFAAAALPSLVVVFGIIIDYRYLTPLPACSRPPTIGHKRLELLRRSSLSLGVVVVVGVRERRVKSEGELDQSVQPPAPLVDGRPLLGWRLSPLGGRLPRRFWCLQCAGFALVFAASCSLGWENRGAAGLVDCSSNRRATCDLYTKKKMSCVFFARNPRQKYLVFFFFLNPNYLQILHWDPQ